MFLASILNGVDGDSWRMVDERDSLPYRRVLSVGYNVGLAERAPSGLHAKSTIVSFRTESERTSTSHFFEPCIFQRLT